MGVGCAKTGVFFIELFGITLFNYMVDIQRLS